MDNLCFRNHLHEGSWIHGSWTSCGLPTVQVWLKHAGKVMWQLHCHSGASSMAIHTPSDPTKWTSGERLLSWFVPHLERKVAPSEHSWYFPHDKAFMECSSQAFSLSVPSKFPSGTPNIKKFVCSATRYFFLSCSWPESSKNHISVGISLDMKKYVSASSLRKKKSWKTH